MKVGLLGLLVLLPGCAWWATAAPPPSRPALPEIRYVEPCDPKAVAGLTNEGVEALRKRDILLQRHIEKLERQLLGQ